MSYMMMWEIILVVDGRLDEGKERYKGSNIMNIEFAPQDKRRGDKQEWSKLHIQCTLFFASK